jgi:hypothetical protein
MRVMRLETVIWADPSRPGGDTVLWKPQFREFAFEMQVFGRYTKVEKTLMNAIVESYLQGGFDEGGLEDCRSSGDPTNFCIGFTDGQKP